LWALTLHVYVLPGVRLNTTIPLPTPAAARATPPLRDVQVAVYFGVVSALPFACAPVSNGNVTRKRPAAILVATGVPGREGAPTTIGKDGTDGRLVPALLVAVTVHVYVRLSDASPTTMGAAVAPTCTPALVNPPLLDRHVAVNFATAGPWFTPAA
jgi:hypothetical protein